MTTPSTPSPPQQATPLWRAALPAQWGVDVRLGRVAEELPDSREVSQWLAVTETHALVTYWESRVLVSRDEVIVDPAPDLTEHDLRYLVYSWGGRMVRTLRHEFSLHASTSLAEAGAVGLMGHSTAGKSTTMMALRSQGYPMLTDDLMPARTEPAPSPGEGSRLVTTAWSRPVHVREQTAERLGLPAGTPRLSESVRKDRPYLLDNDIEGTREYPVTMLIQLVRDPDNGPVRSEEISGRVRLAVVKRNVDRMGQASMGGRHGEFFAWAAAVSDSTPMMRLWRPADPERWTLPEVVAEIERLVGPPPVVDLR